jgi:Ribbon-helix-helix protein, copG family
MATAEMGQAEIGVTGKGLPEDERPMVSFRLSAADLARFEAEAERRQCSRSALLRWALRCFLASAGQD